MTDHPIDYAMLLRAATVAVRRASWSSLAPLPPHDLDDVRSRLLVRVFAAGLHERCHATTVAGWAAYLALNARWAFIEHCRSKARVYRRTADLEEVPEARLSSGEAYDVDGLIDLKRRFAALSGRDLSVLGGLARGESGRETATRMGTNRFQVSRLATEARRALVGT